MKPAAAKTALFVGAAAFTGVFFINWCHMAYQCGCTFLWAGGSEMCNINTPGAPDCPWCARADLAAIAFFATLGSQAAVAYWPGLLRWPRALLAFVASPLSAAITGRLIGLYVGYWG